MGKKKPNAIPGGYVALPHTVLNHPNFWSLSGNAIKLLTMLMAQYKGRNNGDLQAGWKYAQMRGWKSQDTLHRAKAELLEKGFIAETRKGSFPNTCSLYGITWLSLDPDPKFHIQRAGFPVGAWNRNYPIAMKHGDALNTKTVAGKSRINTHVVSGSMK